MAYPSTTVKYYNPLTSVAIVRAGREDHKKVWAALTMMRHVQGEEVSCKMIKVCGSIRTCRVAALAIEKKRFSQRRERPPIATQIASS